MLLADGRKGISEDKLYNAGYAEAAADALFASLVQLDLSNERSVGLGGVLYDQAGKLIRNQGAVFNSPLHFIGFSRGTVVNFS